MRFCPLFLCTSPAFCSEHACTIHPHLRKDLAAQSHITQLGDPCQHHSPSKLLPVQSLTALKSRNQKFIIPAVNGKNYWVCTNTAGGIHLLWSCTLLGLTALLQRSVHFGRLFIAPAHSFIRIPVFSFTLRGLPWWEFEGDKSETQSLHRSVRALLFLTHSRVSSAIAASNMSQGELRGNASAIPARNDSPAEILHSYPAASFSARRFIFGTSVQGPS